MIFNVEYTVYLYAKQLFNFAPQYLIVCMETSEWICKNIEQLPTVAADILSMGTGIHIFCLSGDLGAGKTALSQAICQHLNVTDLVNSPTFAIINEYGIRGGGQVFHFDFYRINDEEEAYATGCEDYFFSGEICLIEWPDVVRPFLPDSFLDITIELGPNGQRIIKAVKNG